MEAHDGAAVFNLGNGTGFSVLDILGAARRVTGIDIPYRIAGRRDGDAASLVADSTRARTELGWSPRHGDIDDIVETAWRWHRDPAY